jgi:hypothetical protein
MSSIFSELVAEVLMRRCSAATDSEKILVGVVLGTSAAELYAAFIANANSSCTIRTGKNADDSWTMRCVELENKVTVIPYLVLNSTEAAGGDPNRGNRGFNGKLRDWFDRDVPAGVVRVLLTFDEAPIETQKTAMDGGLQASLTAHALLEYAGQTVRESASKPVAPLLAEVLRFITGRADLTAAEVTRTIHALREIADAANEAAAGEALVELPWLLRDPAIEAGTARQRLSKATWHRGALDRASEVPTDDFEQIVRTRYKAAVAERLMGSRRLGRVQWKHFTLGELQEGLRQSDLEQPKKRANRLDATDPIRVAGASAEVFKLVGDATGDDRHYGAAGLLGQQGTATIKVRLERGLEDRETLHLFTYAAKGGGYIRQPAARFGSGEVGGEREVSFAFSALPLNAQWCFVEIVLTSGTTFVKNYLGRIDLALLLDPNLLELPYEAGCVIDAGAQRFVAADEAIIELRAPNGDTRIAPAAAVSGHGSGPGETDDLVITVERQQATVPVRYETPEEDTPRIAAGEQSAEHALMRFAASEGLRLSDVAPPPSLSFQPGRATVTVGGRESAIGDILDLRRSRWQVESEILRAPELTNFSIDLVGGVAPDPRLQSLAMSDAVAPAFAAFLEARAGFFGRLRAEQSGSPYQTVLAADLTTLTEVDQYLEAYDALLNAVPDGVNWQTEYERILLIDSVVVAGQSGILIAPTSPLAVAIHQQLQRALRDWADGDVANLLPSDPDTVTARYATPLLRIQDAWHESDLAAYPWRRYRPRSQESDAYPEPFLPGFIERRITEFLEVHPVYRDHRRTLSLAFINPGDAEHVRRALQATVDAAAKRGEDELDRLPQFEAKLYADNDPDDAAGASSVGAALDSFMTNTQESAPSWREQELMRRLTYTKSHLDEFIADTASSPEASSFAHIAFVQNYFRPGELEAYELDARSTTAYGAGSAVDLERSVAMQANDVAFSSGIWFGKESRSSALARILGRSAEIAAAARGNPVTANRGLGTVTRVSKRMIPAIYDRAVWVVHLDRHIGLELFYPQDEQADGVPYILDHTDQENLRVSGFDAITATSLARPYLARIEGIFGRFVAGMNESRAGRMLRWLNLLSGRWALRLLSEPDTAVKERLGAVVAFRFLATREHLFDRGAAVLSLVVSLDELLRVTGKEGLKTSEGLAAAAGLRGGASDDLLLLRIPLQVEERTPVFGRVIEVKYSEGAPATEKAWGQVDQTQRLLERMFGTEGPGKPFRGRVLSKLIRSYVSRLGAFGLLDRELERDHQFISAIDRIGTGEFAFKCDFTRDGVSLIGDFISVEPNHESPLYQAAPYAPADEPGRLMGRVRLGGDMISALIADSDEARAGSYSLPAYDDGVGPGFAADQAAAGARREGEEPERLPKTSASADAGAGEARAAEGPLEGETRDGTPEPPVAEQRPVEASDAQGEVTPHAGGPEQEVTGSLAASGTLSPDLLADRFSVPDEEVRRIADELDQIFGRYQLPVQPFQPSLVEAGPNVIRFRTRVLEAGTIGSIEARGRDIHRELGVEDPVYIGQDPPFVVVDVPRAKRTVITFNDILPTLDALASEVGVLPIIMGINAAGHVEIADLAQMPHLLVAGTTGSGKSVFLSTIGACLGLLSPRQLELVVVDIKGIDLMAFSALPHTRGGLVIEDSDVAVEELQRLMTDEVRVRRAIFRESGARHIVEHYQRANEETWPKQIVVIIDEYAQLVTASGQSRVALETLVQQYAQFARAFGIYLVLATQRPSVDVITGRIKANLPARCVFRLPSFNDSRTVIDTGGAEKLLGAGDMLFYRDGALRRLQTIYTDLDDFTRVASRHR